MRVLHLNAGNLYGGIETFLRTLAQLRHLCPDMNPEFGLCFRGRNWKELEAAGVPVYDLGAVRLSRPWTIWSARRRLRALLRHVHYDAVVVHGNWLHVVFAPEIRRHATRLIFMEHGPTEPKSFMARLAAITLPDRVIANSHYTASRLDGQFQGIKIDVIHLPLDLNRGKHDSEARHRIRQEMNTPSDKIVILQSSRMQELKGHRQHIAALNLIRDQPNWEAWIAGGGQRPEELQYMESLRKLSQESGIQNRVRFLGERADVGDLMAASDIYCQPNTGPEAFGLAYAEALSAGLVVIASNCGGVVDIVDDSCGVLVEPGDTAGLAQAIRSLIAHEADRRRLARQGPGRVFHLCDPARQLQRLMQAFT